MYLVRPRPCLGESLSSWRQHCGLENGFRIFPLAPMELRRADPDLSTSDETVAWLSEAFRVRLIDVAGMTLRSLDRRVLTIERGAVIPRWVVPLRYSRRDHSYGAAFCPICLQCDKRPFFRLRWRLALSSACEIHGALYQDRCPRCGHPAWPASAPIPKLYADAWHPVHVCPVCCFDLRDAPPGPVCEADAFRMSGECFENDVFLTATRTVPAYEYAAALWVVCQLFIRNRSHRHIVAQRTHQRDLAVSVAQIRCRSVEDLPIATRHKLTTAGHALFNEWPNALLEFCDQHNLSAEHFSEDRGRMPAWFESVVFGALRRQVRGISLAQIEHARTQLLEQGKKVTKAAVGRLVGAVDGKLLGQALGRRTLATEAETLELIRSLGAYMREPTRRRSSNEVRVRNVAIILISILTDKDISEVVGFDNAGSVGVMAELAACRPSDALHRDALACLTDAVRILEELRQDLRPRQRPQPSGARFSGFRGGSAPVRGAQKALRECMTSLDSRLARSVRTFVVPYRAVQMNLL